MKISFSILGLLLLSPLGHALETPECDPPTTLAKVAETVLKDMWIPEILELKDGDTIPKSILIEHDANMIAASIVERLRRTREKNDSSDKEGYYDFRNDTQIQIVFSDKIIEKIHENGFLNSHETGRAKVDLAYAYGCMMCQEVKMSGLKFPEVEGELKKKVLSIFPKYGYLSIQKEDPKMWKSRLDKQYGNMVAVLKPHVKDRVTFTPGNSYVIPHRARSLDFKTMKPMEEPNYGMGAWGHHWEAQTWGTVTMDDVDYFLVSCSHIGENSPERIKALKAIKKPIYKCQNDEANSKNIRGKKIH